MDTGLKYTHLHSRSVGAALTKQMSTLFDVHQSAEVRAVGRDFFDCFAYV